MLEREFKSTWLDLTLQYARVRRVGALSISISFVPGGKQNLPLAHASSVFHSLSLQEFITEFFDQNPISQMAVIVTRDGQAERMSALGGEMILSPF